MEEEIKPRRRGRPPAQPQTQDDGALYMNVSKVVLHLDGKQFVKPTHKVKLTESQAMAFGNRVVRVA